MNRGESVDRSELARSYPANFQVAMPADFW